MMKNVRKALALAAAVFLTAGMLGGCKPQSPAGSEGGGSQGAGSSTPSGERKEPITLTYASWDKDELNEFLVQKFEQMYDYVTVELVKIDQNSWEQGLFNLATTGDLPDAFWTFDLGSATVNGWTRDITSIYDADEYTKKIPVDIRAAGVYGGKRYGLAVHQFPWVVFVNKTLFEQANVPLPSYDWTLEDLYQTAKALSMPKQYIFGVSNPTDYFRDMYPAAFTENLFQFGFNPAEETFDLTLWADGYNEAKKYLNESIAENLTAEEKEKAYGKADIWTPETGKLGIQLDWFWTNTYMKSDAFTEKGIEWLIYPLPTGSSGRVTTIIDLGAVSATTEHPEEAYALLKFMTFGAEGWKARRDFYNFNHSRPSDLPLADDSEVWDVVREFTPGEDYAAVYESLSRAVPDIQKWLPGYGAWWSWSWEEDIWGKLQRGEAKPEDLSAQMGRKLKSCYDEAMTKINARSN